MEEEQVAARPQTAGPANAEEEECCVCVAVHLRPLIDSELSEGCQECLVVESPDQPVVRCRPAAAFACAT